MHFSHRLYSPALGARVLRYAFFCSVVVLVLAAVVRVSMFTTYRVAGSSMVEALHDGDRILVTHSRWIMNPLKRGRTVILSVGQEVLVKRLIALPGDRIAMWKGLVILNGDFLNEDIPADRNRPDSFPEVVLGKNEFFVLGDHRRISVDSRDFGPVKRDEVIGSVLVRFSQENLELVPMTRAGTR